jgi:hypothetical protein
MRGIVLFRRPAADALADIDPGADCAAIARARPGAEIAGLEDGDGDAGARQLERGVEARIAAADDGDIGRRRQIGQFLAPRRPGLPPIGKRLEVGMEDAISSSRHVLRLRSGRGEMRIVCRSQRNSSLILSAAW